MDIRKLLLEDKELSSAVGLVHISALKTGDPSMVLNSMKKGPRRTLINILYFKQIRSDYTQEFGCSPSQPTAFNIGYLKCTIACNSTEQCSSFRCNIRS